MYRNRNCVINCQVCCLEEIKEKNMTLQFEDADIKIADTSDVDFGKGPGSLSVVINRLDNSIGFVLGPAEVETLAKALSTMSRWGK